MFEVEQRLNTWWGPSFDLSSLAAMIFLGRSGMQAAAHHAPADAGRRRFVVFVLPHLGIDADGRVGRVQREGQRVASPACGRPGHGAG
jgi:Limiting CO2-inducible proteins B/C beta carbonyic anhydrases